MSNTEDTEELPYARLALYGFCLEYPEPWDVELQPKSSAEGGDIAFKSPGARFFLTWGLLEKALKKYGTLDDQVNDVLKKMKKSGDVRRYELVEQKQVQATNHRAIFTSSRVMLGVGLLAMKTTHREVWTLHLHCEPSHRFYVLYADGVGQDSLGRFSSVFSHMTSSLKCHTKKT